MVLPNLEVEAHMKSIAQAVAITRPKTIRRTFSEEVNILERVEYEVILKQPTGVRAQTF